MRPLILQILFLFLLALSTQVRAQQAPDLVIVVVLDQFPMEYLTRFQPQFTGGFKLLLNDGAVFANANYGHAQCITGPGHAAILSGAYGSMNGIVSNSWYDRRTGETVYCVGDKQSPLVGASGDGRSPTHLVTLSLGDLLQLHTGFRSKVISISNKDRAAILMGGKFPGGVYWMDDSAFVSSRYYLSSLPPWVRAFNASGLINSYFGKSWDATLPESAFAGADRDDAPYEEDADGMGRSFPHLITGNDRRQITPSYYDALLSSPYGAEVLEKFARAAVREERLGAHGVPDLLCVSFSSTDYVGHRYGPNSREVEDMALAMDRILGRFFVFVDSSVGLSRCVIALTSDHGVSPIPEYVKTHSPMRDAGRISSDTLRSLAEAAMRETFGLPDEATSWIQKIASRNIYLRLPLLEARHVDPVRAEEVVAQRLQEFSAVARAYPISTPPANDGTIFPPALRRSLYPGRSGDIYYFLKPLYLQGEEFGTSHGDPYDYNTHVPLIIMGPSVQAGTYEEAVSPVDLAPTLSAIIGTELPAGRQGQVLGECLKKAATTGLRQEH